MGHVFGSDGMERMNKTLKQQVQDRDARLSVLERDLRDKEARLEEKTRQATIESDKATEFLERATKAEHALEQSTHELQRAKLNVTNYEERLRREAKQRDDLDKEYKRLEYELQFASPSAQPSSSDVKLAARVKAMEAEIQRKESEISQLRAAAQASKARHGADDFPLPDSGHGRATHVDSGRIADLTNERDAAAEAARTAMVDFEKVQAQLAAVGRERDKAVNSMMATEKRTKKEIEALQEQVDDLRYELEDRGGDPSAADKVRADLKNAQVRIDQLAAAASEKDAEIERLRTAAPAIGPEEIESLRRHVVSLGSELEAARVSTPPAGPAAAHLQRELKSVQRRIEQKEREVHDLQKDLQEAEEENATLRRGGSRGDDDVEMSDELSAVRASLAAADAEKGDLEAKAEKALEEVVKLQSQLETMATEHAAPTESQERVSFLEFEVAASKERIVSMEASLVTATETITTTGSERDQLKLELDAKVQALLAAEEKFRGIATELELREAKNGELEEIRQSLASEMERHLATTGQLDEMRMSLTDREQRAAEVEVNLKAAKDEILSVRQELGRSESMIEALKTELIDMESQLNEELDELRAELAEKQTRLDAVEDELKQVLASRQDDVHERQHTAQSSGKAKEEVEMLRFELDNANNVIAKAATEATERGTTIAGLEATILQLQGVVASSASEQQRFQNMSNAIQRLRDERDDMQGQLKFVTTERHFQLQAANDEKTAVASQLRETLDTLRQKNALYDTLKAQQDELASRVAALQEEAARAASLEGERDAAVKDATTLQDKTVTLRKGLEAAATRAEEERTRRKEAENRAEAAELAVPSSDVERKKQLDVLYARIARRDQRIKNMSVDYKKLEVNHSLTADDLQEASEELEAARKQQAQFAVDVEKQRIGLEDAKRRLAESEERVALVSTEKANVEATLQREYDELKEESDSITATHRALEETHSAIVAERDELASRVETTDGDLESAQAQLSEQQTRVAELEDTLAAAVEEAQALAASTDVRDLVLAISVQYQAVARAAAHARTSEAALRTAIAKVGALEDEQGALLDQASRAGKLREELEATRGALALAEARGSSSEEQAARLVEGEAARVELQTRVDALQGELEDVASQLAAKEDNLATLTAESATTVADLEGQLQNTVASAQQAAADAASELTVVHGEITSLKLRGAELTTALEAAEADVTAARAELDTAAENAAAAEGTIATLRADVLRLEGELAASVADAAKHSDRIEELVSELSLAKADQAALGAQLEDVTAKLEALTTTEAELRADLAMAQSALDEQTQAAIEAKAAAEAADREAKSVSSHFRFMEKQKEELSARVTALRDELASAQAAILSASAGQEGSTAELTRLVEENKTLRQEVADLQEDLQRTIDSLTYKTNEVDEADDRALELNKEITRLRKGANKLERQNRALSKDLESMRSAKAAAVPPPPSIVVAPPAVEPSPTPAALAAGTPSRPFNVFAGTPAQNGHGSAQAQTIRAPHSGTKRAREDDADERGPGHAEARVQAGPVHKHVHPPGRSPFASRNSENRVPAGNGGGERPLSGKKSTTAERMFAAHKAAAHAQKSATPSEKGAGEGEQRTAFAPRNAFAQ